MQLIIFALMIVNFAVPSPVVNWVTNQQNAINIVADGKEELLDRCLDGGIEVRYRFEMRYCAKGSFWFDQCEDETVQVKSIKYDPIKEIYKVDSDIYDDEENPQEDSFTSKSEALAKLATIENVDIEKISRGKLSKEDNRHYVGIRVLSECRGSVGNTLLDISYYITFGLVKVSRFDSGWVAFYINK